MLSLDLNNPDSLQSLISIAPQTLNVTLRGTIPVITLSDGVYDVVDFLRQANNSNEDTALWLLTHPELKAGNLVFQDKEENAVITLPNVPVNAVKLPSQVGYRSLKLFMPSGDTGIIVSVGSHKRVNVYGDMRCTEAAFVRDNNFAGKDTSLDLALNCSFDKVFITSIGAGSKMTVKSVRNLELQLMRGIALDINNNVNKLTVQKSVLQDCNVKGLSSLINEISRTKIYDSEFRKVSFLELSDCAVSNVRFKDMPRVFLKSTDVENTVIEGDTMVFVGVHIRSELVLSNLPLLVSEKGYYTHEFKFLSPMSDGTYTLGVNFSLATMNVSESAIRMVARMGSVGETLISDVLDKDTAANFQPNTYFNRSITLDFTSLSSSQGTITVRVPIQVSLDEMDTFEQVVSLYSWEIIVAKTLLPFRFKTNGAKINLMVYPVFGDASSLTNNGIYRAKKRVISSEAAIRSWTKALPFSSKSENGALISRYTRNVFNCLAKRGLGTIETCDFYYSSDYIQGRHGGYYASL